MSPNLTPPSDPLTLVNFMSTQLTQDQIRRFVVECCEAWNWLPAYWKTHIRLFQECIVNPANWQIATRQHEAYVLSTPWQSVAEPQVENHLRQLFGGIVGLPSLVPEKLGQVVNKLKDVLLAHAKVKEPELWEHEATDRGLFTNVSEILKRYLPPS